jgi:amidase
LLIGDAASYPDLLDVGAEELIAGLENGAWTSVDLTKVCYRDLS